MDNYHRPRDVVFPAPGPVPEYVRKATIRRIIQQQQQQQERIERENNTSENSSQNNNNSNVALQQEEENGDKTVTKTKAATTSSEINGIDHNKKINGHSNAREINNGENDDKISIDHEDDESEKDLLNSIENISNNKDNNESTQEIILSSQDQGSLNKEPINPEPPPEPPDDENGESSNSKRDSGKSILKGQNDDKKEEEEEEESSDDSLPDEETLVNKLEELTAKKKQLWQQLRDAKAKQAKKEQAVTNNGINNNLQEETSTNYNTGIHDQSYRVDRHNIQPTSYIPSNRDHYDSNYPSSYHHESDITAFHHQLPFGIKRMNEQTSPSLGQMNKRMRHPLNGMHYEMNHGTPSIYGPPTGPSVMTGNGMMGRGREDLYPYYHRNEFRPPPPTAPYLDRTYGRGSINNMQRRLSGNPNRPVVRPPDRPRGRY